MSISYLRKLLAAEALDGFIIPSWDEFQKEYPDLKNSYLKYFTNFTGSNGIAIIMEKRGVFFTDARYTIQAAQELDSSVFVVKDISELKSWCRENKLFRCGYSPALFTPKQLNNFSAMKLQAVADTFLQQAWPERPKVTESKIFAYPDKYAGSSYVERFAKVQAAIAKHNADYLISTAPECVCWLLGLRGMGQPYILTFDARMIIHQDTVMVFCDAVDEIKSKCRKHKNIEVYPLEEMSGLLSSMSGKLIYDEQTCAIDLHDQLQIKDIVGKIDPIYMIKACKTELEVQNAANVHIQDAIALCEFFAWLDEEIENGAHITEYAAGLELTKLRSQRDGYICDSFATICAFASNGAIMHYSASQDGCKIIDKTSLLLVDSGGHYYGGTTDVTRTMCFGTPTLEQVQRYTDVLKGNIGVSVTPFPRNAQCSNMDVLSRQYLWDHGLDYPHSTGHGVGNAISVHESPPRMHYRVSDEALHENMILSNEPGYYKEGHWGIRIEDLVYISSTEYSNFLRFEHLTMMPYERKMIDWDRISARELICLRLYYDQIRQTVLPHLKGRAERWCKRALTLPE